MAARDAVALFVRDPACQEDDHVLTRAEEVVLWYPRKKHGIGL
tara:strand:- start:83 stop:211 length:129 start_codon:yes stop_codon:yes gene_type:complete